MNKKGISPLISTFLLIFFAIALGLIVMSWGKTVQLEEAEEASCGEVSLDVVSVPGQADICYKDGKLKFTAENSGHVYIDGLRIFIISDQIEKIEQDNYIIPADIVKLETAYSTQTQINKIKLTPRILDEGEKSFCPKKGVEIENIGECK